MDPRLYQEAYRLAEAVGTDERRSRIPLRELYPSLVEELARRCPGFSKREYESALERGFMDSR